MALRPATARWFELLTSREQLAAVLDCLASTGMVELECHSDASAAHALPALRAALDEYRALAERYATFWPAPEHRPPDPQREPEEISREALASLKAWAQAADALIGELQTLSNERTDLKLLAELLQQAASGLPDLGLFRGAGPTLATRVYVLPGDGGSIPLPPSVLTVQAASEQRRFVLAVGPAEQIPAVDDTMSGLKARRLVLPADLPTGRDEALATVRKRLETISRRSASLEQQLDRLSQLHALPRALGDFALIEWLVTEIPELPVTEHFAWATGWTSDPTGERLEAALDGKHLDHLLRFAEPPADFECPVILRNPRWARPFELFAGLLGVPGARETDPSSIVAVIAPLMFGFMFGDVGQGAVLIITGAVLRKRLPALGLLVPGGAAAMVFGVLFGSVFASEALIPALWLHPLAEPLTILAITLGLGACVVLLGLALDAIQHHWAGLAASWWATRAGLVLTYLALLAAPWRSQALWIALCGLLWYLLGETLVARAHRFRQLGSAAGEAAEALLQFAVNTISFVRVGAFALAHAGLCAAIVGVASALDSITAQALIYVAGNALIIALEGLVVGIQTTRLVLFEFFIRFLKAQGRRFRPLVSLSATRQDRRLS